jgi:hypothetical protein
MSCSTPLEVFAHIKEKLSSATAETRARIVFVLERWIVLHLYDFLDSLSLTKVRLLLCSL